MLGSRKNLFWKLYLSYIVLTVLALAIVASYVSGILSEFYYQERHEALLARAQIAAPLIQTRLNRPKQLQQLIRALGKQSATRFTIIRDDGTILADSHAEPKEMDDHRDRPEIDDALKGKIGSSRRHSSTTGLDRLYVAIPLTRANKPGYALRTSFSVGEIEALLHRMWGRLLAAGSVILLLSAAIGWFVFQRIRAPLTRINEGAKRYAAGDLGHRIEVPDFEEVAILGETMNQMAVQLQERIELVTRQRDELEAMLASMVEGVLMVDPNERVLRCNRAAARWFDVDPLLVVGRFLQEVIRTPDLLQFVTRTLRNSEPQEETIVIHKQNDQFLQLHGARLQSPKGVVRGALVVLNDISRLKRLERVRRDFVANVSHELKTPITTIKGFVETLVDGAIEDPKTAIRFLGIMSKHADRLNLIIEDLLRLSRIEQEEESGELELESVALSELLRSALFLCKTQAEERSVKLSLNCAEEIVVRVNRAMVEQVVVNLVDNGIKYSEKAGLVEVVGVARRHEVRITVRDFGRGIEEHHLPRLFERFYRVDKARSRAEGGTGLGLAIVKHIVNIHGGRIEVSSEVGIGTCFTIHFPKRELPSEAS